MIEEWVENCIRCDNCPRVATVADEYRLCVHRNAGNNNLYRSASRTPEEMLSVERDECRRFIEDELTRLNREKERLWGILFSLTPGQEIDGPEGGGG